MSLAAKMDALYCRKEQETFKEERTQSVKMGGLSNPVRELMGRGVNWEDEGKEEEGLVVGELGTRVLAEQWSMGEAALVQYRMVTGRESMTYMWVPKNSIASELSQIQPFSSYLDLVKCNFNKNDTAACVCTRD